MRSLLQWVQIAVLAWVVALLIVLLAEVRGIQRLIPDWLRSLSRIVVLVGTVGVLTAAILFGGRVMMSALEARNEIGEGAELDLSFDSTDSFLLEPVPEHAPG